MCLSALPNWDSSMYIFLQAKVYKLKNKNVTVILWICLFKGNLSNKLSLPILGHLLSKIFLLLFIVL